MARWIAPLLLLAISSRAMAQADPIQVSKGTTAASPGGSAPVPPKPALPRDGIASRVNNEIITWKDVDDTLKSMPAKNITDELRLQKLRKLSEERLFLQAARQNNLSVTEQEMDEVMKRELKRYPNEEEFERALRANNKTKTEYREELRKDYLVSKLYRHLIQKAFTNPDDKSPGLLLDTVSPLELRKHYDEHRDEFKAIENITVWRMGLQYGTDREKEQRRREADAFLRRIAEGADFYVAAVYFSTVSPVPDGEKQIYGHRALTREKAAEFYGPATVTYLFDTLKEDEVSAIRDEGRTLNVFKVVQRVNQKSETFEEAQGRIRIILENQKREENRRALRAHLTKSAYVWPADLFDTAK
jgi:hypothetical protein